MTGPVLVTGAGGKAGREVARALTALGATVRPAARRPRVADQVALDFTDPATWPAALDGCEAVFLMRPPAIAAMRLTLIPFIAAARGAGVRRIVFLSVIGAEGSRIIPHAAVERALQAGPRDWTLLRPGFFAQNLHDAYRRDIIEDGRIHLPAGEGRVAFLDLRDLGAVAARALAQTGLEGEALALTGPAAVSFDEVCETLSRALGRPIRYEPASLLGYLAHLRRRGRSWPEALVLTRLHAGLRRGEGAEVTDAIPRLLGRPATSVEEVIRRDAETWRT